MDKCIKLPTKIEPFENEDENENENENDNNITSYNKYGETLLGDGESSLDNKWDKTTLTYDILYYTNQLRKDQV